MEAPWKLLPVGLLLLTSHLSSVEVSRKPHLSDCLVDSDQDALLQTLRTGLNRTKTPHHVVIVGAGIAGLTAAKLLQDAGHQVTVLESSDRIGGRIETYRSEEGWYADLGAMRIPVSHHATRWLADMLGVELSEIVTHDPNTFYLVNGLQERTSNVETCPDILKYDVACSEKGKSADALLQGALQKVMDDVQAHGCASALRRYGGYSVKEFLEEAGLSSEAVRMIGDLLNQRGVMHTSLLEMIYDQSFLNDDRLYEVVGGMDLLPRAFLEVLSGPIFLKSKVKHISQSEDGVIVSYHSGNHSSLTDLPAEFVLVTTTARATLLMDFAPPLSVRKMEALRSSRYEGSVKIILTFREKFWERDGIRGGKSITDRPSRYIYYPSHSFPNRTVGVLLASYTLGEDSALFLGVSEQDLKELVLRDLAQIHGERVRSLCTGIVVKKWSLDPHSLGAFAFFTPSKHSQLSADLFQSESRVHFSGEHVAFPHGWMETSVKSAIRAAININGKVPAGQEWAKCPVEHCHRCRSPASRRPVGRRP